jgi:hypothetical protein
MKLAGTIPSALAGFETLDILDLSFNQGLIGTLPEILGGLTSLRSFDISFCSGLTGSLPSLYAAMAALENFNAANCSGLEGSIPPSWVLLKNLQFLQISSSKINGTLPDWTNAQALRTAAQAAERIARRSAGPTALPNAAKRAAAALSAAAAGDVVGWSRLVVMLLSDNALEGTVPASYSTLLNLAVLDLSGNGMLSGPLPSLGKLELLEVCYSCYFATATTEVFALLTFCINSCACAFCECNAASTLCIAVPCSFTMQQAQCALQSPAASQCSKHNVHCSPLQLHNAASTMCIAVPCSCTMQQAQCALQSPAAAPAAIVLQTLMAVALQFFNLQDAQLLHSCTKQCNSKYPFIAMV